MKIDNSKIFTADMYQVDSYVPLDNGVQFKRSKDPFVKNAIVVKVSEHEYADIFNVNTRFKYKRVKSHAEKGDIDSSLLSTMPDMLNLVYLDNIKPMFTEEGKTSARQLCKQAPKYGHDLEW